MSSLSRDEPASVTPRRPAAQSPPGRRSPGSAPPVTCSRTFPATPSQIREARQFLTEVLDSSPLTTDALLCLSELVTNAIEHSRSARAGGRVTVRATKDAGIVRVEVEDEGGPWQPRTRDDPQRGRGLLIVGRLAHNWEISGDGTTSRTVSFELRCPPLTRRVPGAGAPTPR
jgi:anti-sigma regulatory factor (Ser/Thr protein kinase)